jgi:hypothetical protein
MLCPKFVPYEWVDSNDKLYHIGLPAMAEFYAAIKHEDVSVENYEHGKMFMIK